VAGGIIGGGGGSTGDLVSGDALLRSALLLSGALVLERAWKRKGSSGGDLDRINGVRCEYRNSVVLSDLLLTQFPPGSF
jgi:hypothetical protein